MVGRPIASQVPFVPVSHPFVERLIGTIRQEFLDHVLIWNAIRHGQGWGLLDTARGVAAADVPGQLISLLLGSP
jgi:hypothetical protein